MINRQIPVRIMTAMIAFLLVVNIVDLKAQNPAATKKILEFTENNWVAFRNYNGRQLIYFTHLTVYRCDIKTVRYSLASDRLDQIYQMPPCNPQSPNTIPDGHLPYLSLPLGSASEIYVQVTFKDGSKSRIVRKTP